MNRPHSPYHARRSASADLGDAIRADRWTTRTHDDGATFTASPETHDDYAWTTSAEREARDDSRSRGECGAQYDGILRYCAAGRRIIRCTLAPHSGREHADHVADAPAILAWTA